MRQLLFAVTLSLLASACTDQETQDLEVRFVNDSEDALYVEGGEGRVAHWLSVVLEVEFEGEWAPVRDPVECGPGSERPLTPFTQDYGLPGYTIQAHALLPGDSIARTIELPATVLEGDGIDVDGSARAPADSTLQATFCHSDEAFLMDEEDPVEAPEESGPLPTSSNPGELACETFVLEAPFEEVVELEVGSADTP